MITLGDFKFVVATTPQMLEGVYRLRYQVYVDEFGYEHAGDHPDGKEVDVWDPFSIHMAALNPEGDVIGTIRLVLNSFSGLPTLNAVAVHYQDKNPKSRHIGEVSRLAVARSFRRRVEDGFQGVQELASGQSSYTFHRSAEGEFPSQERRKRFAVVLGLFKILYHVSKRLDLRDWYMMAEKRLWYLLKRYHILFNAIGPEMDYHGKRIPYLGHIADIESHMMKVSANLAESFQEGLAAEKAQATPPSVPETVIEPESTKEEVPFSPVDSTPEPLAPIEQAVVTSPVPYFTSESPTDPLPPSVQVPFSEEEAERKALAAAQSISEIVWPQRIPRRPH
ncbi:MAG: PEP-CTERM/exosortase system-associated acyltransferase [Elusimicrobia bacterium]|jgi:N-acyl amino acid synthase of PEP-CTERM/exosortase system|nr:PEP-CTERM/exosortase system-associated acyltransferase [Elusimicrobiota bacterium]